LGSGTRAATGGASSLLASAAGKPDELGKARDEDLHDQLVGPTEATPEVEIGRAE
jgi:hypothetical protein